MQAAELWSMQNALQGYLFYINRRVMVEITSSHEQDYARQPHRAFDAVGDRILVLGLLEMGS